MATAINPAQRGLFTSRTPSVKLNSTVPEEAKPRLNAQHQRILERLEQGPATNRELSEIALRYSARIAELRAAGFDIQKKPLSLERGVYVYELEAQ